MNFLNRIKEISSNNKFSITALSLILFYCFITLTAIIIFQQFKVIEVLLVSFCFVSIFLIFNYICNGKFYSAIQFNFVNIIISLLLTSIMLIIFFNDASWLSYYYSTYPLLETDLGLFWHEDTAYHVSLIQSIINFGYPSIAMHDVVVNYYHVLSHYIDALIVFLVDIEPYDSYGLLFHFKKFLLISSVVFFIMIVSNKINTLLFLLLVILLFPFIIYTWHAIGSHGLWFTTILLLFFLPKIVLILQKENNRNQDFIFIFIFVILISFGKVSTGFMLGVFLGLFLLYKNVKDFRIYILSIFWILFFLYFSYLMAPTDGKLIIEDIHRFKFEGIILFLFDSSAEYFNNLLLIYSMILIALFLGFYYKNCYLKLFAYSLISAILTILILIKLDIFSIHDIWYFTYGLYSVSSLMFLIFILNFLSLKKLEYKNFIISLCLGILFLGNLILFTNFYSIEHAIGKFYSGYFQKLNSTFDSNLKYYSIQKLLLNNYKINFPNTPNGLQSFRKSLEEYMKVNDLSKTNTLLFIPKDVYEKELTEKTWARGMLVYAVTGVPILNGIGDERSGYGFSKYSKNNLYTNEIDKSILCINNKNVILINSIKNKKFEEICIYKVNKNN